jgi:hypothetical protein
MQIPDEIRTQLLTILAIGVRNIRAYCERRQYDLCWSEANHVHNLPDLIENFSADKLAYYLEVEVVQYRREMSDKPTSELRAPWNALRRWLADFRQNPTGSPPR